jgi:hypothetical protein
MESYFFYSQGSKFLFSDRAPEPLFLSVNRIKAILMPAGHAHRVQFLNAFAIKQFFSSQTNLRSKSLSTLITLAASISMAGLPSSFSATATFPVCNFGIQLAISSLARS